MLQNLSLGKRDKKVERICATNAWFSLMTAQNEYIGRCVFTMAAKIVRKTRAQKVENVKPQPGEVPHAKVIDLGKSETT